MSQIYKLNHIEGEEIKHIYIFSSDQNVIEPDYIDSNENPIFSSLLFTIQKSIVLCQIMNVT